MGGGGGETRPFPRGVLSLRQLCVSSRKRGGGGREGFYLLTTLLFPIVSQLYSSFAAWRRIYSNNNRV